MNKNTIFAFGPLILFALCFAVPFIPAIAPVFASFTFFGELAAFIWAIAAVFIVNGRLRIVPIITIFVIIGARIWLWYWLNRALDSLSS